MNCGEVTPRRRHSGDESRIPVPSSPILRRSGSQRLNSFSPIAEHSRNGSLPSRSPLLIRHRSLQSLNAPLSSCISPDRDDDLDSVHSFGSNASVTSTMSQCDHASFARNGTTFSSRQKRYVVHCSPQKTPGEEYLTPTQRANRTIRRLKNLLGEAQAEIIEKDQEIFRLTKEVVELRLLKAGGSINEKEERNDNDIPHRLTQSTSQNIHIRNPISSREVTSTSEQNSSSSSSLTGGAKDVHDHPDIPYNGGGISPAPVPLGEVPPSLVDSGHFEDLNNTKEWGANSPHNSPGVSQNQQITLQTSQPQTQTLSQIHPSLENLRRQHEDEIRELREKHNDKVDSLLQRITETNDRYYELRPKFEAAEKKIHDLEQENETLKKNYEEAEEKHKAMYLEIYKKGQEAAQLETEIMQANKQSEQTKQDNTNEDLLKELDVTKKELENIKDKEYVSSNNLLSAKEAVSLWNLARKTMYRRLVEQKQTSTQHDPEMTLQFLKSAIYYFLTDRENTQGHLAAIESILGFTDNEKLNIEKASYYRR
ncbi:GRIP domain-containing protein quick-to-court isoform X3 [Lycorma delicatula]